VRYGVALPQEAHMELVQQIIGLKLTSRQVQQVCERGVHDESDDSEELPFRAIKIARLLQAAPDTRPQDLARALRHQEYDIHLAHARIQSMLQLLKYAQGSLLEE
jgi:hypothetical protein